MCHADEPQVREKLALKAVANARLAGSKHDALQRLPRRYAQLKDLDACAPPLCARTIVRACELVCHLVAQKAGVAASPEDALSEGFKMLAHCAENSIFMADEPCPGLQSDCLHADVRSGDELQSGGGSCGRGTGTAEAGAPRGGAALGV